MKKIIQKNLIKYLKLIIVFLVGIFLGSYLSQSKPIIKTDSLFVTADKKIDLKYEDGHKNINMEMDTFKYLIKNKEEKKTEEKLERLFYRMDNNFKDVSKKIRENNITTQKNFNKSFSNNFVNDKQNKNFFRSRFLNQDFYNVF